MIRWWRFLRMKFSREHSDAKRLRRYLQRLNKRIG